MNQVDYKKMYDEALERMKSWTRGEHPECFTEAQKAAEFVFPELKECEDERIRKAILELVKQSSNILNPMNQKSMIAWLEKQGESYTKKDVDVAYLKAKQELERQGEQNPTWSEEDERLRYSCIAHIEEELEEIRNDKYGHSEIISDLKESCRERIKWLESLKERFTIAAGKTHDFFRG